MMEANRLRHLFLEEEYSTPIDFSPSRAPIPNPLQHSAVVVSPDSSSSPTGSLRSTLDSSSSRRNSLASSCGDSSCAESVRTTTSSAPSLTAPQLWQFQLPDRSQAIPETHIRPNYTLDCEFAAMLNCKATFSAEEYDRWVAHSLSHFSAQSVPPPSKSVCTFCDEIPETIFENALNPYASWRDRLFHMKEEHFAKGDQYEDMRPDFFLVVYMKETKLLKEEDFDQMMKYTEREKSQCCDGLLRPGEKTKEMIRKDEKSLEVVYDLVKEERLRRKERTGSVAHGFPRSAQIHQNGRQWSVPSSGGVRKTTRTFVTAHPRISFLRKEKKSQLPLFIIQAYLIAFSVAVFDLICHRWRPDPACPYFLFRYLHVSFGY